MYNWARGMLDRVFKEALSTSANSRIVELSSQGDLLARWYSLINCDFDVLMSFLVSV